ncbi:MAG: DUF885 domain-containing protein, partial [Gemmatimonadales bacterium]
PAILPAPVLLLALLALLAFWGPEPAQAQTSGAAAPTDLVSSELPLPGYADPEPSDLRHVVERFSQDRAVLGRRYSLASPRQRERMEAFYQEWIQQLDALDYQALNVEGAIDWQLLRNRVEYELSRLEVAAELEAEAGVLLPFQYDIVALHEARRDLEEVDPREAAETLHDITEAMGEARARIAGARDEGTLDGVELSPEVAMRAVNRLGQLRQHASQWFSFHDGYDPMFSWWVRTPWEAFDESIRDLETWLRRDIAGMRGGNDDPIIGDPLGREALVLDLANELVAYSPEELMEIAEYELAWGREQMLEASRELGFGDDWQAALEHVKGLSVEPGEQTRLVKEFALEAEEYMLEHDLVTLPEPVREVWRMEMLSPQQQRTAPFFLGGEVVRVAFPTDGMAHQERLMSLRANNEHFSRAVVHHELIPGHHLQGFMTSRYSTHRSAFSTPFWGEGWALYWELLLWDMDFARSAEDRMGMLFWRNHRAARILFSLAFHMEEMTPEEAIDFLIEEIGHEPAAAEAEVRRSFTGQYSPLYQAGYLLGGLQIRQLHRDLVESGEMSNRAFHDHILKSGRMPIAMVRQSLLREAPPRDYRPSWRFHPQVP